MNSMEECRSCLHIAHTVLTQSVFAPSNQNVFHAVALELLLQQKLDTLRVHCGPVHVLEPLPLGRAQRLKMLISARQQQGHIYTRKTKGERVFKTLIWWGNE